MLATGAYLPTTPHIYVCTVDKYLNFQLHILGPFLAFLFAMKTFANY